ncbi:hypothetical protein ACFPIK_12870 [Algoriphagus aquatilis]|uniref:Uncharacterized protein n=1 Tax=Algoriphagus aquatilis TaxID=490186 RepID=A0ABW0BXI2_9BACT
MKETIKKTIFVLLFLFIMLLGIIFVFYFTAKNEIEFSTTPEKLENLKSQLIFPSKPVPEFISTQEEKNILYQAIISDNGVDKTFVFKTVIRFSDNLEFENPLPLNSSDKKGLNELISFNEITEGLNPSIKLPENNKIENGRHVTIFSSQNDLFMPLKNGSYSFYYDEIDKEGTVTDIIIFDRDAKLLYFERIRYFAFQ